MIIFAHRGASGDYPENTMLAFKKAIEWGTHGIEFDVHKSKDNELIVIHDETVQRTFKAKGFVNEYNLKELKSMKNRRGKFSENIECKIPTLREVLELISNNKAVYLNIELKNDKVQYKDIEEDIIRLIYDYEIENRVTISSFNHNSIKVCKRIAPHIKTGILYHHAISNIVEYALEIGAEAIHPYFKLLTIDLIEECHKNNIKVNTYTVNQPLLMRRLIEAKVDGIFSDYPKVAMQVKNTLDNHLK